jgi:protein TonB
LARSIGLEGVVLIECTIDTAGRVHDARVLEGHPLLREAAREAVAGWRYSPGRLNGVPVEVRLSVMVRFELR